MGVKIFRTKIMNNALQKNNIFPKIYYLNLFFETKKKMNDLIFFNIVNENEFLIPISIWVLRLEII